MKIQNIAILACLWFMAIYFALPQARACIAYIKGFVEYFRQKKAIKKQLSELYTTAGSCNPESESEDKGIAIAKMIVFRHKLEEME